MIAFAQRPSIAEVGELAVPKLIKKQMITNYSKAEHSTSSPNFGNTYVRHSTVNYGSVNAKNI